MPWYKVTLSADEISAGKERSLVNVFALRLRFPGAPPDAAICKDVEQRLCTIFLQVRPTSWHHTLSFTLVQNASRRSAQALRFPAGIKTREECPLRPKTGTRS
jgi:hypothetical protein